MPNPAQESLRESIPNEARLLREDDGERGEVNLARSAEDVVVDAVEGIAGLR